MIMEGAEIGLLDNTGSLGPSPGNESNSLCKKAKPDWTDSYNFWSKWEDTDEAQNDKRKDEAKVTNGYMDPSASFMGHDHDHAVERKLLELSECEKMKFCENHRRKGNYLFLESIFPKAAEQYQLALSYYEYCFPDDDETQAVLDSLRRACLCNISLCFYRMGHWRMALNSANQVIQEDENNVKALFRRAQAYRALDEYGFAEGDIIKASKLCPKDIGIQREMQALMSQKRSAFSAEKDIAQQMLRVSPEDMSHNHAPDSEETFSFPEENKLPEYSDDCSHNANEVEKLAPFLELFGLSMPLEPGIPEQLKSVTPTNWQL